MGFLNDYVTQKSAEAMGGQLPPSNVMVETAQPQTVAPPTPSAPNPAKLVPQTAGTSIYDRLNRRFSPNGA
jgi:hypothetical protein